MFTTANIGGYKDYYFSCELTSGEDVSLIAPEPISKTKPIVNTKKNIIATVKPKVLIWYRVTAAGKINKISRSKIKKSKATIKKWMWNVLLVWPGIASNPHEIKIEIKNLR